MCSTSLRFLLLFLFLAVPCLSDTLLVPSEYSTIQSAIDAAKKFDTVLAAPGTYHENISFLGKKITVKSEEGPLATTIDGGQVSTVVRMNSGEKKESVLDGFTITNGSGFKKSTWTYTVGGGIYVSHKATLINNIITENTATSGGGINCGNAILLDNLISNNTATEVGGGIVGHDWTQVRNCVITGNKAKKAGGVTVGYAARIIGNTITFNSAELIGGGLHGGGTVRGNIISYNVAGEMGGGIYNKFTPYSSSYSSNMICMNSAAHGGGIYFGSGASATTSNNTCYGNTAGRCGGGLMLEENCYFKINNSIFWLNQAPVANEIRVQGTVTVPSTLIIRHSDLLGGKDSVLVDRGCWFNWGSGMIDADPLLIDPAGGDFRLLHPSPCLNSGDNDQIADTMDFEGDRRISDEIVDMGGDEFHRHLYYTGEAKPGGEIRTRITGPPGREALLFIAADLLPAPIETMHGIWYLAAPIFPIHLGIIPGTGLIDIPWRIPSPLPGPMTVPLQCFIPDALTNLCLVKFVE